MKCDTCKFNKTYIGSGQPDDPGAFYCSKGHWEGCDYDKIEDNDWDECDDYKHLKTSENEK